MFQKTQVVMTAAALTMSVMIGCATTAQGLEPARLRCEHLTDPQGVDVATPRLSWIVTSAARDQKQAAYHVLVASTAERLAQNQGDLWDSGKVASDQTIDVKYAGKPLKSHGACWWKVQVWDADGKASGWSKPARWSVGLLNAKAEWKAKWIGYDAERVGEQVDAGLAPAKWIAYSGDPWPQAAKAHRLYVHDFKIPADALVHNAKLVLSADDSHKFTINGQLVSNASGWNQPRLVDVTGQVKPGDNTIRAEVINASEGPAGLIAKLIITLHDQKTITVVTDESWHATDNPGANWHNRPIDVNAYPAVKVVAAYGDQPWGKIQVKQMFLPPVPYLRHEFALNKPVKRTTVYVTGLGLVDVHLNGERVSDDLLNPGWTDYTKRVYYRAYDVTDRVKPGANAIGAILADGWYSGYVGYGRNRDHYGKQPRAAAQLHIEYADGSTDTIVTDEHWRAATGPIREADFLQGEFYDAAQELTGWDTAGYDASAWKPVITGAEVDPIVQWHPAQPVRPIQEFKAKSITQPTPGAWVLNMGQNFAGFARLKVRGKAGQKIMLRFAERLNPDGTIYTTNLRSARTTDVYICKGGGVETWSPRYTFHGFQYVEITGLEGKPAEDTVTGIAISSDTPVVGEFTCSDPMLNQLHSNIYWTQRANFIDIPTDCPQRDERLGWTGDAQVYVRTATLNTDAQAFFTKWLIDLEDAQRDDGQFPMVAPLKVAGGDGGPAWADAGVICPWTIYQVYGDREELAAHYDAMKKFIAFCEGRSKDGVLPPDKYHCFGDWLSIKAHTPKDIIYTAYFANSVALTARTAEVLGRADDANRYRALHDRIKAAFNKAYVMSDGRIKGNTQTCYVLALAYDLLDSEKASQAAKYLIEDIESRGWHLSTGFIGTKDLMLVLAKIGRNDVAYRLMHQDTFPSWGFSIRHGATSIWERWDGWTPDKGFQNPGMNSFAHYSFGAVYQWMVENIGGLHADSPSYKTITIAPQPGGKLTHADVRYGSPRGPIRSAWKLDGDQLIIDVTIPANTTATLMLPTTPQSTATLDGQAVNTNQPLSLGSGQYRVIVKHPRVITMPK
ncbi:family 78 glycoside hydrolase catalytic domain [Planctomycetales bacterium ZRK34]|nr:family 78 glycoside hydrolase catalytic domain [Planctomycetales bacterium ZRK34]